MRGNDIGQRRAQAAALGRRRTGSACSAAIQKGADLVEQPRQLDRLGVEVVAAGGERLLLVLHHRMRGERDHGDARMDGLGAVDGQDLAGRLALELVGAGRRLRKVPRFCLEMPMKFDGQEIEFPSTCARSRAQQRRSIWNRDALEKRRPCWLVTLAKVEHSTADHHRSRRDWIAFDRTMINRAQAGSGKMEKRCDGTPLKRCAPSAVLAVAMLELPRAAISISKTNNLASLRSWCLGFA